MAKENRNNLKNRFKNGMKPDENDFGTLIDSMLNFNSDDVTVKNGNVGIKTTDPKGTLHVYDAGTGDPTNPTGKSGTLVIGNVDGRNLSMDNNEILARNGTNSSDLHLQRDGGDIKFFDGLSGSRIVIKDTGKMGVGTADPKAYLHLNKTADTVEEGSQEGTLMIGAANGQNLSFDNNEIMSRNGNVASNLHLQVNGGAIVIHDKAASAEEKIKITDDGKIGIGTLNPAGNLHIGIDGDKVVDNANGGLLILGQTSKAHMSFDSNEIQTKSNSNTASPLYINQSGGKVVIGRDGNFSQVDIHGNISVDGQIWHHGSTNVSDMALKRDINPLQAGLDELRKLNPVSFRWKDKNLDKGDPIFGFVAQEVQKVFGSLVHKNEENGNLGISTTELVPVLVRSVQEQQHYIEKLESRLEALEKKMDKK